MAREKIDYGIDLGTTNSAIARMEHGIPIIKKSEGTHMDTTPSCINFNIKKRIISGGKAYRLLESERLSAFRKNDPTRINTFEEFKREMGSQEQYVCDNMGKSFSSEELSAEVLKALKAYIRDEEINSIVITVPAKFTGYQKDATKKAAEIAGFQHCILVQEPIAASIAYGMDAESIDGEWLVFDFGGGTFDVALMKATEGIMKVIDTEGNNHLGGKNLDIAIVHEIIMPYLEENYSIDNILANEKRKYLLQNAVKRLAEDTKINLSPANKYQYDILTDEPIGRDDEGNEIEIDLSVTKKQYEEVVKPIFQRAIELTQKLLEKNKLVGKNLTTVLMIGGPTFSETLRNMVREQITENINISIDPMTAVAIGAALMASTKDIPSGIKEIDNSKIQLKLMYSTDTVEMVEKVGIRVLRDKTDSDIPEKLFVEICRQDKGWSSGKVELKGDAEIFEIYLEQGKSNGFSINLTDDKGSHFPSEPKSFSVIQGFKVAGSVLAYDLCIDVLEISAGKQHLINLKGLQKNQPLPAKGTGVFHTQKDVRPGNKSDQIRIPVYEDGVRTRAIYNNLRGNVIITGDDLPSLLPKGSEVELTVHVDESEMITVSTSFPYLDDHFEDIKLPEYKRSAPEKSELEKELNKALNSLENLQDEYPKLDLVKSEKIHSELNRLVIQLHQGGSEAGMRDEILNDLRESLKEIDKLDSDSEWPKVMEELTEALEHLKDAVDQYGNEEAIRLNDQFSSKVKAIIEKRDIKMAKDLDVEIRSITFKIADDALGPAMEIGLIKGFDDNFDMHEWKNISEARQLINEAKSIVNANRATKQNLRPIVGQLFGLLPQAQQSIGGKPDDDVLVK
jgi:molecular chaperone DnaK